MHSLLSESFYYALPMVGEFTKKLLTLGHYQVRSREDFAEDILDSPRETVRFTLWCLTSGLLGAVVTLGPLFGLYSWLRG